MRKLFLLLVLVYPLISFAQHDDIYFVPKKEKKLEVTVSARVNSFVGLDDEAYVDEYIDEDAVEEYCSEDYSEVYYDDEDYTYSTRILRFRSPHRLIGNNLYWDLMYNCGINDWLLYDEGYYIDVYPTYHNPIFYWPRTMYNLWSWNVTFNPYYSWNNYYWNYNHHWHHHWHHHPHYGSLFPHHVTHNPWRPLHKVHSNVPTNSNRRPSRVTTGVPSGRTPAANRRNDERKPPVARPQGDRRPGAATDRQHNNSGVRPQSERKVSGVSQNMQRNNTGVRKQVPNRNTTNGTVRRTYSGNNGSNKGSAVSRTENRSNSSANGGTSNRSSYRSKSSSSGEYNRPSSTSVSRQRSSSSSKSSTNVNSRSSSSHSSSRSSYSSGSRGSSSNSSGSRGVGSRR